MNSQLKALLLLIVNLALNGSLWLFVPIEYKGLAILIVNLLQVAICYFDPTYAIQKIGMSKSEYLGRIKGEVEV